MSTKSHWDKIYKEKSPSEVSWTQEVPVTSIKFLEKFNIDNNLLYHLDTDFKPGDYIKHKRKEKAVELFAKGLPIEKIAKATGNSVSYLKRYFKK